MEKRKRLSRFKGVSRIRGKYYICRISTGGVQRYLGCYPTPTQAFERRAEELQKAQTNPVDRAF